METSPGSLSAVDAGAAAVSGLGAAFLAVYVAYLVVNEAYVRVPPWLLALGALLAVLLAVGLGYAGYWLAASDLGVEQSWRVLMWTLAGVAGALSLTFWPIFYQRAVGVGVEDPGFILLVSVGLGANAGALAGVSRARSTRRFRAVQSARDLLEFLNRLLRHNVLNAVNIIQGNAAVIEEEAAFAESRRRSRTIRRQSARIEDLVDNTRVLVQRSEGDDETAAVDFSAVVAEAVDLARATYRDAVVESDLEPGVRVRADRYVSTVVTNLVTNAVEHNDRPSPWVEVVLETEGETALLRVRDDGPGIPDDRREAVLRPGPHGDEGLGLHLVDTLVDQYGGAVRIADRTPRGTVVTVELPRAG